MFDDLFEMDYDELYNYFCNANFYLPDHKEELNWEIIPDEPAFEEINKF